MKKILSYISATALCAAVLSGCAKDGTERGTDGRGALSFTVAFGGAEATRADAPENCVVKVATAEGNIVYEYTNLADIPAELWLTSGDYIVVAEGGVKTVSGFDAPFYKGSQTFTITANDRTNVAVNCVLQNALFTVAFDESVTGHMSGYSVTLKPVAGDDSHNLVFDAQNPDAVGYVLPSAGVASVEWVFGAEHEDYGTVAKSGVIPIEARKLYDLTFRYSPQTGIFALDFTITVDEESIDEVAHNIPIFQRPKLTAIGFDISETQTPADSYEIAATSASPITAVTLTGSVFGAQGIDLLTDDLTGTGVHTVTAADNKISIFFTSELFDRMSGENEITITITDSKGKTNTMVFRINASGIDAIPAHNIWATFADVSATVFEENPTVRFAYRAAGSSEWAYADGTETTPGKYSARISGLAPSSAWEMALEVNGQMKGVPVSSTTAAAPQLPNSGFESWRTGKGGVLNLSNVKFPDDGTTKFWDSANKGLGKDITYDSSDVREGRSGSKSAYMYSTIYSGTFAAGNLYTGNFKSIDISSLSAEVNFGQPFTGRPSALKGWYKASPGAVTNNSSSVPHLPNGATDEYQIYIMLTNWTGQRTVNPKKAETLIDFSADYIIGLGQISDLDGITGSETVADWTQFTIPIKYRSNQQPTYIVVVACASKYGDYFVGSTNSVLQVDDFELIYDHNIVLQD